MICKQRILYLIYAILCPFISKSGSSVVDRSLRNPWIGGSNPGGNYTSFSVECILFPPKTVHFVPLTGGSLSAKRNSISGLLFCRTSRRVAISYKTQTQTETYNSLKYSYTSTCMLNFRSLYQNETCMIKKALFFD